MIVTLPHKFTSRDYQVAPVRQFADGCKRIILLWHRRAGKDKTSLQLMTYGAISRVGLYLYMFPELGQARKVIWNGIDKDGMRFLDHIPRELIRSVNNTEMSVTLINGSIIQMAGSDRYDNLMGANPVGLILSEYSIQKPEAWRYFSPMLLENGGFAIFPYTPRGQNHGYDLYNRALESPKWYVDTKTVADTGVMTEQMIEEERQSGMPEELIQQEYYCSFEAALVGSYYAKELRLAVQQERIRDFDIEPGIPCVTAWDVGNSDATSIWIMQPVGRELRLIYYIEDNFQPPEYYASILFNLQYELKIRYAKHWLPHDAFNNIFALGGRSTVDVMRKHGLQATQADRASIVEGIASARYLFPRFVFHKTNCHKGIEALKSYRSEYDAKHHTYKKSPVHDWSSHCFTGDTLVLTRSGMRQIIDLPRYGEVMTLWGWMKYQNAEVKKRKQNVLRVEMSDGVSVMCTPDHKWLTGNGWISAEKLEKGTKILSCLTRSHSTSKDLSIGYTRQINTFPKAAQDCIGTHGLMHLEKYQTIITSTTKMGIKQTIVYQISNYYLLASIAPSRLGKGLKKCRARNGLQKTQGKLPLTGIHLTREENGIEGMRLDQKVGQNGKERLGIVRVAEKNLRRLLENHCRKGTATITARQHLIEIKNVKKETDLYDVYCLEVPGINHFSLSNGAIVHNCADAFRYLCTSWRDRFMDDRKQQITRLKEWELRL